MKSNSTIATTTPSEGGDVRSHIIRWG
jgi:hypothetical protein